MIAAIFVVSLGASLLLAAKEVMRGSMTPGDFVLIASYVLRLSQPLEGVGYAVRDSVQGIAFLKKLLQLFSEGTEREQGTRALPRQTRGALRFEDVGFGYRPEQPILEHVTFVVPAGSVAAIVGESGAGKSTLARLALQFLQPTAGEIFLDDVPIRELAPRELRAAIAVVPQDTPLFHASIAYNIGLGRAGCSQAEIEQASKEAHLHDFVMRLPDGYATIVGERGVRLSGGERQRVAIARALIKRAPLVICDEPTSSLDPDTERRLLPELLKMAHRQTTICITHRLSIAQHASMVFALHRGRIVEQGSHAALMAKGGVYAQLWEKADSPVRTA
jgi:ATP-binding cassette subfamily B protein